MTDRLGQNAIQVLAASGTRQLSSTTVTTTGIKWHPGHYGASLIRTLPGNSGLGTKQQEISTVRGSSLLGWLGRYQWATLQSTVSNAYDFSTIKTDYTLLTGITNPGDAASGKRMMIQIMVDNFNGNAHAVVPQYIWSNPGTYGAASNGTAGEGGYCKYNATSYVAALWRPSVATAMNNLLAALGSYVLPSGNTVDYDPYIEAFISWEIAAVVSGAVGGSDWSDPTMIAQTKSNILASVAAFPTTNVAWENNYAASAADTLMFHQYLQANRCGWGGPDIFGKSLIDGTGTSPSGTINNLTWGQQVWGGFTTNVFPSGNQDMRGLMPCMHEIEDAELVGYQFGPYTPQDIMNCAVTYMSKPLNAGGVTHMLWDIVPGNSPAVTDSTTKHNIGTNPGNIGSILTMIASNQVPFIGKPANYTAINTT